MSFRNFNFQINGGPPAQIKLLHTYLERKMGVPITVPYEDNYYLEVTPFSFSGGVRSLHTHTHTHTLSITSSSSVVDLNAHTCSIFIVSTDRWLLQP